MADQFDTESLLTPGGSRGSGAAVARRFTSAGAQVAFSMLVPRRLPTTKPRQQGTKLCTRTTRAVVPRMCSW
jgi:NAD(P)-dependent dehydrogenase (short-subunit alcohol dehydrogenase family)